MFRKIYKGVWGLGFEVQAVFFEGQVEFVLIAAVIHLVVLVVPDEFEGMRTGLVYFFSDEGLYLGCFCGGGGDDFLADVLFSGVDGADVEEVVVQGAVDYFELLLPVEGGALLWH